MTHDAPHLWDTGPATLLLVNTETKAQTPSCGDSSYEESSFEIPAPQDDVDGWDYEAPPAYPVELEFRHGFWRRERELFYAALRASGASPKVLHRVAHCGADSRIEYSRERGRHRVVSYTCRHRMCRACSRTRSRIIVDKLCSFIGSQPVSFTTLTLRADGCDLVNRLKRLDRSISKLMRRVWWRKRVTAGAVFLEVTLGEDGRNWHIHAHILHLGPPLSQTYLSDVWLKITGDSFIVHSERVTGAADVARYVTKYVTKGVANDVFQVHERLVELLCAFRGRRLFRPFGDWYGMDVEREDDADGDWTHVEKLPVVAAAAVRGEPWAIAVFLSLGYRVECSREAVRFPRVPSLQRPAGARASPPDG